MSYKIDISNIIDDHLKSLINRKTKKPDFRDWFFFLFLPLILSSILIYYKYLIDANITSSLISGLSIYVGLSINFLMLIFELSTKKYFREKEKKSLLTQVIANISVTTIYSILIIILTLMTGIKSLTLYTHFVLYFFIFEFLITLLMVLKRIYKITVGTIELDLDS